MVDERVVTTFMRCRRETRYEGYTMTAQTDPTRRTFLKLAGATTLTSLAAGCLGMDGGGEGGGGGDGNGGGGGNGSGNGNGGGSGNGSGDGTKEGGNSPKETFKLGGEIAGWQGKAPSSIEGKTNPTLQMTAGTTYEIVWVNLDGAKHELIIETKSGEHLVATEHSTKEGQTRRVTFEATTEMASYFCEYHPTSMRGKVAVSK